MKLVSRNDLIELEIGAIWWSYDNLGRVPYICIEVKKGGWSVWENQKNKEISKVQIGDFRCIENPFFPNVSKAITAFIIKCKGSKKIPAQIYIETAINVAINYGYDCNPRS